jgi:hypothetical protein
VARHQPINAEVPAGDGEGAAGGPTPKPPRKRPRGPAPLPLKLVGGAILLAVVFIAAAILGGGSGNTGVNGAAPPVSGGQPEHGRNAPTSGQSTTELGYPAFATKNTSRVGGEDAAANAAGVALAVFPSTDSSQQPNAVTLVGERDWAGALAASVLMAAPIRAPILVSGSDGLPEASEEALGALDPQGSKETGGAQLFAIGAVATPGGRDATRVEAGGAAATAAAIAALRERVSGSPPEHVVVASEDQAAFAMPAAAWAARSGDPVLFAGKDALPAPTAAALRRHPKTPVYVLGPSSAISSAVVRRISAIDPRVRRVSGENPVRNAIALARYDDHGFGWNVNDPGHGFVVARSDSPLDAAAAAPLSASGTWGPLLLTDDADRLPAALHGYLLDVKPGYSTDPTRAFYNHVWVIGDQEAIAVQQQAEIDSLAELAPLNGAEP